MNEQAKFQPTRMTTTTRTILAALLDATGDTWGLQIMQATHLGAGSVYPILTRLEKHGWIEGYWETEQPVGRPRRRYWKLTTWGAWRTREALGRTTAPNETGEGEVA